MVLSAGICHKLPRHKLLEADLLPYKIGRGIAVLETIINYLFDEVCHMLHFVQL